MSPATKSKSKDKTAARAVKEQSKASSKPSAGSSNSGNGTATSAYNPISGTFHALENVPSNGMPTIPSNGRFRTIDDEEHSGSSLGTAAEYDSVSNNDSCSGESEDQQKEKNTASNISRVDPVPGSDIDKREKIRLKNEKKHQRQKERRAQELHERCCSYLTSRKLESLAQKLVAMGFTSEQATMALIHNEGRVDDSALWLLEGGEESKRQSASNVDGANPKIDIADELARITELELSFKCTKQEVERVVVACEGDLEKTEETLKTQKQESTTTPPKLEESSDQPTVSANGFHNSRLASSSQNSIIRPQGKGVAPASVQLQRRDEREFNYTKSTVAGANQTEIASRNLQPTLRKLPAKQDWMKSQAIVPPVEKRWPSTSSSPTPYSLASQVAAQSKPEARYVTTSGSEVKANLLQGTLREPIYVMQRPQSSNGTRQNILPVSVGLSASPPASTGWYPSNSNVTSAVEMMKLANGGLGQHLRNLALSGSNPQQFYPPDHHQQYISSYMDSGGSGWGGSYNMPGTTMRSSSSSSLAVPSSLGLFTGWGTSGSSGSSSPVNWSTRGTIPQCDYTSIDWSLDSTPLPLPSSSIKGERLYDNSWQSSYTPSSKSSRPVFNDGGLMVERPAAPSAGSPEWTSPFGGKDLFRVPRQFVTSPSP
ncbi:uncharacterized protein LOC109831660 isoform X2 [Asparagus officinalis]|nr:uncharacterized protein LOC109831660 isoform X2 [Asparagus officinalis]